MSNIFRVNFGSIATPFWTVWKFYMTGDLNTMYSTFTGSSVWCKVRQTAAGERPSVWTANQKDYFSWCHGSSAVYWYQNTETVGQKYGELQEIFSPLSAPFPVENSHLFSQSHVCFSQLRKVQLRKIFFFFFLLFRDNYYLWETMTLIRMLLKHLCLA